MIGYQSCLVLLSFILIFPKIGSRSVENGASVVSSFKSSAQTDDKASASVVISLSSKENVDGVQSEISKNETVVTTITPCALVTMSLLDGRDGTLMPYDEKTLISVSHETFDITQGIVPTIAYQVVLEIPSGHEFSLEYWLNGLTEEKVKQKRRHQRDRRDALLELYPETSDASFSAGATFATNGGSDSSSNRTSSNEPFVFCSKSSIAGVNREASAKQLKFHWYINGNNFHPAASVSGIPSNVIFRLRFRSIVEATTSVFEQNLSILVRSDCYLQLKVEEATKLTLDSLWNHRVDNNGVNCTVFIVPKKNFGLEINLSSLSVYGMRDICKGRYLQFTRSNVISSSFPSHPNYSPGTTTGRSGSSSTFITSVNSGGADSGTSNQKAEDFRQEEQQQQYSPLESRFCGKLEDYFESERTLTFPSPESTLLSSMSPNSLQDGIDNEINRISDDTKNSNTKQAWGVYLTVRLPVAVKAREAFSFDLTALSPCQRVSLNGLDGQLEYSKHYENDQCSIVLWVPYGNTILAQISVSSSNDVTQPSEDNRNSNNNNDIDRSNRVTSYTTGQGESDVTSFDSSSDTDALTTAKNLEQNRESLSISPKSASSSSSATLPIETGSKHQGGYYESRANGIKDEEEESNNVNTNDRGGNEPQNYTSNYENDTTAFSSSVHSSTNSGIVFIGDGTNEKSSRNVVSPSSSEISSSHLNQNTNNRDDQLQGNNEEDIVDNFIPLESSATSSFSYECPVTIQRKQGNNDVNSVDLLGKGESGKSDIFNRQPVQIQHKHLLIQAVDLVSGSEFNWCFDAAKQNSAHKRAWKSSGNRVSIKFRMSYFDTFKLTYQSVKIPELAVDCERGWVKVDSACVLLVERRRKWTDAEESCQLHGGHLVTVKGELNENKLEKIITESPFFHPSRAYWIGANDRESEGNFQWTSGLPFQYKNWFPGWTHQSRTDKNEILSAQPNDDGWSGQDCVEIRQILIPPSAFSLSSSSSTSDNTFAPFSLKSDIRSSKERGHAPQFLGQGFQTLNNRKFYWNDRNCDVKNFYLCEKGTHQNVDVSCNKTLKLSPPQVSSVVVTSPAYPSPYPDNMVCVTSIETIPGFKLVLLFDEFILEESLGCQYDSLEILEYQADHSPNATSKSSSSSSSVLTNQTAGVNFQYTPTVLHQQQHKSSRTNGRVNNDSNKGGKKICGDWTKKLKLLRYTTASKSTQVILKFESDFSHHFPGFKVKVTAEKDMEQQCTEQKMTRYGNHCYSLVSFPAVTWATARHICETLKGNLASVTWQGEWSFLSNALLSTPDYDKKSIYWLGGSIDQNYQLGWVDHMPFNFSGFHPSDLQTRFDFRCLSMYWHEASGGSKGDLAWRLTECSQTAGYICKKKTEIEFRQLLNRTFSGTGGKLASPNYPSNYVSKVDHRNHLVAPKGTKIIIRFSHLDVEPQENCLYDYVEIVDDFTSNKTRFCGSYMKHELNRLDYVSSSNELDVLFHTDFSNTFTGYELLWRAVDVTSCTSGKTIMAGFVGSPFPLGDQTIHTPNFPYFNLPNLDCVYHIIAPAGQRLWLSFQVFELGQSLPTNSQDNEDGFNSDGSFGENMPWTGVDCLQQDHVSIDVGQYPVTASLPLSSNRQVLPGLANDNEILICGNLSSTPFRTSFISSGERVVIRVRSPQGHTGRGFLGRFKAIPHALKETFIVNTLPNSTMSLTSLNFPLEPPPMANLTVSFIAPPHYVIILKTTGSSKCAPNTKSFLEVNDPYVGNNGLTRVICHLKEMKFSSYTVEDEDDSRIADSHNGNIYGNFGNGRVGSNHLMKNDDVFELVDNNGDRRMGHDNVISLGKTMQFRSRFNRLDIKQVYLTGFRGERWNAQIITTLNENSREEYIADGDRLLVLNACSPNHCLNGGTCVSEKGRHICRCPAPFTGPFCALSVCDVNPCLFGECIIEGKSFKCQCQLGYGGERCERRYKPCDDRPCAGHGDCIEVNKTSYKCQCHAWWEGPQCESRMLHIPYKPLSQRMLEEPFWLGLITVFVVMGVIGLIWCLKRHFPEKLEKFLSEDLERNRGISWAPSSVRTGGVVGPGPLGLRDAIPGTSQQAASPPTTRSFLGRLGIRKPSLLSLSSATSNVSATVASPHTYENRTFSLDDLLRPSKGMLRTPSPHRRRNYSVQVRRDPAEKQQILQQLVSPGGGLSSSFDGESKPATPKPTLAEIIQMSEKRLRLASQSSMQNEPQPSTSAGIGSINTSIDSVTSQRHDSQETSFTTIVPPSMSITSAEKLKAEKKVTFAHMLDKLAAGEMTSSSSCSDVSCGEDSKIIVTVPAKPVGKKDRKGRFRRSKSYRSRTSEEDCAESSDTTPDPIFPPRFPLRSCISPTSSSGPSICTTTATSSLGTVNTTASGAQPTIPTSLSAKPSSSSGKLTKIASADSLLSLFRRFSGSSSAPPSPQYSENEESSAGATPLSTPSSPRNSALNLRPPAFLITSAEPSSSSTSSNNNNNNTIELPVIDPFSLGPPPGSGWNRSSGTPTITLEVPMRDYCLSPIHEVPTPLPTPSHSPAHTPMMRRPSDTIPMIKVQSSEDDDSYGIPKRETTSFSLENKSSSSHTTPRKLEIPVISISMDDGDNDDDNLLDDVGDDDIEESDNDEQVVDEKRKLISSSFASKAAIKSKKRKNFPGEAEVIPDVLINVPPDASLESKPDHAEGDNSAGMVVVVPSRSTAAIIDLETPLSPTSAVESSSQQGKFKPRPPPLIFANEILSCTTNVSSKDDEIATESTSTSTSSSTSSSCCSSNCTSTTSSTTSTASSCAGDVCGGATGNGTDSINNNNNAKLAASIIPLLNIEFATPVSEALPKFATSPDEDSSSISDKIPKIEVVSCLEIPQIWDCPLAPPMITINQSSEAESDSDTTVTKSLRRPNLNFLSPFGGDTIRVPSESNLSTSGYSSMASPCASRCPSVSPLCPSEMDDYHNCHHSVQHLIRRASLTPGTPKKESPTPRRSSLNSATPFMSFSSTDFLQKRSLSEEKYDADRKKLQEVEIETDSAVEVETDLECQSNTNLLEMTASNTTLSPPEEEEETKNNGNDNSNSTVASQQLVLSSIPAATSHHHPSVPIFPEELKCINSLLQVPRKGFPKSRSLDINSTMINDMPYGSGNTDANSGKTSGIIFNNASSSSNANGGGTTRHQQLKALVGPSLDSKLNSIEPFLSGQKGNSSNGSTAGITISLPLTSGGNLPNKALVPVHSSGNLIEIPDENKEKRLSPASSRSESPLSELNSSQGRFMACPGSPVTDSDGIYDYPSSEVPSNNNDHSINIGRVSSLNKLSPQQQLRRSGRRKDRRLARNRLSFSIANAAAFSASASNNKNNNIASTSTSASNSTAADLLPPPLIPSPVVYRSSKSSTPSSTDTAKFVLSPIAGISSSSNVSNIVEGVSEERNSNQFLFSHIDLPPNLARESLVPVGAISKRASPKRRIRAQPALDASSSSSESLSSRSRSRTSVNSFQHVTGSPKRLLEEVEATHALSDSAIGKHNSISEVVSKSNKDNAAAKSSLEDQDCILGTRRQVQEPSPKPDVIQQQPTSSVIASLLSPKSQDHQDKVNTSPVKRKISRLRTISHQIRFLRRLELSLIRKKECLTAVSRPQEVLHVSNRRDSFLARSESWDTSREEDMSDSSTDTNLEQHSVDKDAEVEEAELQDPEKPLIPRSSSSPGTLCIKGSSSRMNPTKKSSSSSSGSSSRITHMNLLDNCSAAELLGSHKRKLRK